MKVEGKVKLDTKFCDLGFGDAFVTGHAAYMKISIDRCVNLETGELVTVHNRAWPVTAAPNAKVVLE